MQLLLTGHLAGTPHSPTHRLLSTTTTETAITIAHHCISTIMDEEELSALILKAEWGTYCNAAKIYPSMEISFLDELFSVASKNEKRCATCILSITKGESTGECWALDNKDGCLRCQFDDYCVEASSTLRRLGALAERIHRADDDLTDRDLHRLHTIAYLQFQKDVEQPCNIRKLQVDFYVTELQDLLATYSENSDPDESTDVSEYINLGSGKDVEVLTSKSSSVEVDEESFWCGLSDDVALLTPTDSCSVLQSPNGQGDREDPTVGSPSTLDLEQPSRSNMKILDRIYSFTSMYKSLVDETSDLLASYVKNEGHMPGILSTVMRGDANADAARLSTIIERAIYYDVVPKFPAYYDYKKERKGLSHDGETPAGSRNTTDEISPNSSGETPCRGPDAQPQERSTAIQQQRARHGACPSRLDPAHFKKGLTGFTLDGLGQFVDGAKWAIEAMKDDQDSAGEDAGRKGEAFVRC